MPTFALDAVLASARVRHWREHDHHGFESDEDIVLSEAIGPHPAGTTLAAFLVALEARLVDAELLETVDRNFGTFSISSFIGDYFTISAVISSSIGLTFTINAVLIQGSSFSIDAVLAGNGGFTLDALLV